MYEQLVRLYTGTHQIFPRIADPVSRLNDQVTR